MAECRYCGEDGLEWVEAVDPYYGSRRRLVKHLPLEDGRFREIKHQCAEWEEEARYRRAEQVARNTLRSEQEEARRERQREAARRANELKQQRFLQVEDMVDLGLSRSVAGQLVRGGVSLEDARIMSPTEMFRHEHIGRPSVNAVQEWLGNPPAYSLGSFDRAQGCPACGRIYHQGDPVIPFHRIRMHREVWECRWSGKYWPGREPTGKARRFDPITPLPQYLCITVTQDEVSDSVESLLLPKRIEEVLKREGVTMVHQLVAMDDEQLRSIRGLGERSVRMVRHRLERSPI